VQEKLPPPALAVAQVIVALATSVTAPARTATNGKGVS
jgi:hypothetical protein